MQLEGVGKGTAAALVGNISVTTVIPDWYHEPVDTEMAVTGPVGETVISKRAPLGNSSLVVKVWSPMVVVLGPNVLVPVISTYWVTSQGQGIALMVGRKRRRSNIVVTFLVMIM
jgi:hypothetical protein